MGAQTQLQAHPGDLPHAADDSARIPENLGVLYQGVLTSIVRLQSGRQHITDGESFRKRTKSALAEIERAASAEGYDRPDIEDSHFAVAAFLDEVVLHSADPVRADWERRTLQEELFNLNDAGVVFFERLGRLEQKRDSRHLANVLEIFLLCLLLGFQGRYSGNQAPIVDSITSRLAQRIREVRGRGGPLSPFGVPEARPVAAPPVEHPVSRYFAPIMIGAVVLVLMLFLVCYWNLSSLSSSVNAALSGRG